MMFLHLFQNSVSINEKYGLNLLYISPDILGKISLLGTICVSVFAILSGYGISLKLNNCSSLNQYFKATLSNLIKLLLPFIFVFVIAIPFNLAFNNWPYENIGQFVLDLFGMSYLKKWLFDRYATANGSWWYITVAVISYILSPIIKKLIDKFPVLVLLLSLLIATVSDYPTMIIMFFIVGMILQKFDAINSMLKYSDKKNPFLVFLCTILSLITSVIIAYPRKYTVYYLPLALSIIAFSTFFLSRVKYIRDILAFLGRHSGNIYFFHMFICDMYFTRYTYFFKYPVLIFIVFTVVCVIISIIINLLRKITQYDNLISFICKKLLIKN